VITHQGCAAAQSNGKSPQIHLNSPAIDPLQYTCRHNKIRHHLRRLFFPPHLLGTTNKMLLLLLLLLLSHILSPTTATPTAFCEPSKAHVFPEKLTRRKIKVNPVTGAQTFYETSNTSPEQGKKHNYFQSLSVIFRTPILLTPPLPLTLFQRRSSPRTLGHLDQHYVY